MKKGKKIQLQIVIFTAVKNRCILHGRVFVMLKSQFMFSQDSAHIVMVQYICIQMTCVYYKFEPELNLQVHIGCGVNSKAFLSD